MKTALILAAIFLAQPAPAPTILDFTATWCGPCKTMKPAIAKLKSLGYHIDEVDIDADKATAKHYGVTAVPTFVALDESGKEVGRRSGACEATELGTWFNDVIDGNPGTVKDAPRAPPADVRSRTNPSPWETSVRVRRTDAKFISYGSGTVVYSDAARSIVLTCGHIFRKQHETRIPKVSEYRDKIEVDMTGGKPSGNPPTANFVVTYRASLVDCDLDRDIAVIEFHPGKQVPFSRYVPPSWAPGKNMAVDMIGCKQGQTPTLYATKITKTGVTGVTGNPSYIGTETLYSATQGRSGGGLFTDDGYLCGLLNFASDLGGRFDPGTWSLFADPAMTRAFLDKNKLSFIYAPAANAAKPEAVASEAKTELVEPIDADERGFRLFQAWCKRNPPQPGPQGLQGPQGIPGQNGKDGADGKDATGGTPVDLTAILNRLTALEAAVAKPITFKTPQPDGTEVAQKISLGGTLGMKIPSTKALADRIGALEAKVK